MAYFSNGSEGMCLDEECIGCKYGQDPCPIYNIQMEFNYKACNNEVATKILNALINNHGDCSMKQTFIKDFKTDAHNMKIDF